MGMGAEEEGKGDENKTVLDPGHGGNDPGTEKREGDSHEKDIALDVAKRVNVILSENDINVSMTREDDSAIGIDDRRKKSNDENAKVFVSFHVNATEDKTTNENSILIGTKDKTNSNTDKLASSMINAISAEVSPDQEVKLDPEKNTYDVLLTEGVNDKNYDGRGNERNNILNSGTAAVVVEMGFLNNPANEQLLNNSEYLDKLATGIANGIINYYGNE